MARAPGEFRGEKDYLSVELVTRPRIDTPIRVSRRLKIRAPLDCLISSTLRAGGALPEIF
jgi:hypothetical protein